MTDVPDISSGPGTALPPALLQGDKSSTLAEAQLLERQAQLRAERLCRDMEKFWGIAGKETAE